MSDLIAAAVASGRRVAADYRPDTMTLARTTQTSDGAGGTTGTATTSGPIDCVLTVGATRPEERAEADRAGATTPYVIRNIPLDADIRAGDEATIGGRTFRIVGVLRTAATNVAIKAVCEERG